MFEGTRALLPSAFAQYSCSKAIHLGQLSTNCFPIILESTQKARVSISSCFRALLWLVRKTKLVIESSFEELNSKDRNCQNIKKHFMAAWSYKCVSTNRTGGRSKNLRGGGYLVISVRFSVVSVSIFYVKNHPNLYDFLKLKIIVS